MVRPLLNGVCAVGAAVLCLVVAAPICAEDNQEVLATVGTETITRADLEARIAMLPPQIRSRYESQAGRRQLLERAVALSLFAQEARHLGIDQQEDVAHMIRRATEQILAQAMNDQHIPNLITLTDEDIQAYYEKNRSEFSRPEQINVSVIMFAVNAGKSADAKSKKHDRAQETLKRLHEGADFAHAARDVSDDDRTQRRGGATGFFSEGRRDRLYGKKFEEVAFALQPGEISEVFETNKGYFIIRLDERRAATEDSLDDVRDRIERRLRPELQRKAYHDFVESLKQRYEVTYSK